MSSTATETAPRVAAPASSIWRRYRRLWIACTLIVAAAALYFTGGAYFAYTDDAYVRSDLVAIAPEVSGIVKTIAVANNQAVAAGDLLATIDPRSFQLDVDLKQQEITRLEAAVAIKSQLQAGDAANIDAAAASLQLAQQQYDRARALTGEQYASQEQLDKAADQLRAAQDELRLRQNQSEIDDREIAEAKAQVEVARAQLALAQYNLSRTRLTASVSGFINNLALRPGAYARTGEALIGIIDGSQWRVVANFKEDIAASVAVGQRVWVWLDSDPWHFRPGHVQGVGRGIARSETPTQLLPYVPPSTDWIRLRRRLQVTILLDHPTPERGLFMGADARVFFLR
ncbi:MAG TPA: HlyD family secretion protein [Stellaceae bacterium]|nr:HlyD family secretion protein [Stellaceae bacterium]